MFFISAHLPLVRNVLPSFFGESMCVPPVELVNFENNTDLYQAIIILCFSHIAFLHIFLLRNTQLLPVS